MGISGILLWWTGNGIWIWHLDMAGNGHPISIFEIHKQKPLSGSGQAVFSISKRYIFRRIYKSAKGIL